MYYSFADIVYIDVILMITDKADDNGNVKWLITVTIVKERQQLCFQQSHWCIFGGQMEKYDRIHQKYKYGRIHGHLCHTTTSIVV